jgi:nicotinamide N-methyltransferase
VCGHKWGETDELFETWGETDELFETWGDVTGKKFDRIVAADCMWMEWEHDNLCASIRRLLKEDGGVCLAIAGFHTGRAKVAGFFEAVERAGLKFLRPVVERDVLGKEREWVTDRGREDPIERKRYVRFSGCGDGRWRMG